MRGKSRIGKLIRAAGIAALLCLITGCNPAETKEQTPETESQSESAAETAKQPTDEEQQGSDVMEQYLSMEHDLDLYFAGVSTTKDIPAVHVMTYEGEEILSKDVYVPSVIDVFNCGEEYRLTAEGGVKVRGNSTAQDEEKPYRIKFEKKQSMLGLHDGEAYKSWVLLRTYWNLAPDYMAFRLGREIFEGEYYCSDAVYVNLYINKKYMGMYLLCEQNQAADGRVDVYEPSEEETQKEIGYLLEMDNYPSEEHPNFWLDYHGVSFTDMSGETRKFEPDAYSIKSDTTTEEQREFIENYLRGVFDILYGAVENNEILMFDEDYNVVSGDGVYETPQEAVEQVIDLKSAANMLILEELTHNYDVGAGSFYMAVDFDKKSIYEQLTFLAPWDFNWAYYEETDGRYYAATFQTILEDQYERSNVWFITLMKADWFQQIVKDRWKEVREKGCIEAAAEDVANTIAPLEADLGEDAWRISCGMDVIEFVRGRAAWLDTVWMD